MAYIWRVKTMFFAFLRKSSLGQMKGEWPIVVSDQSLISNCQLPVTSYSVFGRRRITTCSTTVTAPKKRMPTSEAMRIAAQSFSGSAA